MGDGRIYRYSGFEGRRALNQFQVDSADLVLLDIGIPEINDLDVYQRLKGKRPVPVILVTAQGGDVGAVRGFDAGADAYLTKPFASRVLVAP